MQYCILCNPDGHGTKGRDGTEAIAKYYIDPEDNDPPTGWQPVCADCVPTVRNGGFDPVPLSGHDDHPLFVSEESVSHECDDPSWTKTSLVTEDGGFDWVECDECGIRAKRKGIGTIEVVGHEM